MVVLLGFLGFNLSVCASKHRVDFILGEVAISDNQRQGSDVRADGPGDYRAFGHFGCEGDGLHRIGAGGRVFHRNARPQREL